MAALKKTKFPHPHPHPTPKPAKFVDATAALRILKNARNRRISKKEFRSDTEYRLFYMTKTLIATNSLLYVALYVGHLSYPLGYGVDLPPS